MRNTPTNAELAEAFAYNRNTISNWRNSSNKKIRERYEALRSHYIRGTDGQERQEKHRVSN